MALPVDLTLEDYWRILRRRQWLLLFSFFSTLGVAVAYSFMVEPVYSSAATLKIEPPPGSGGVGGALRDWDAWAGVNTEMKVMGSATVAEAAARKIGTLAAETPEAEIGAVIGSVMRRVRVDRVGETSLVNITCEGSTPQDAADLAQAITAAYMAQDIESRRRQNQQALEDITSRKDKIEAVLHELEDVRRAFQEKSRASGTGASLADRLFSLEIKKKQLLERYTSEHPEAKAVLSEMDSISRQMRSLPKEELELARITRDLRVNEELYLNLAKQFEEQRVASASVVPLASLVSRAVANPVPIRPNRRANTFFGATLGLLLGLILVFVAENLDTSLVTVEEVEKSLELPVLGLIPHIPLPDKRELPRFLQILPLMGRHEPIEDLRKRMIIYQPAHAPVVEAYHSLRASLESVLPKEQGHCVLFSSAGIAEGKTLSTMNFALAAIQAGVRVVLVEVDLRRPSLHRMLGVPNDAGLTNVLIEGRPLEACLKTTADFMIGSAKVDVLLKTQGIENLALLPSGTVKVNPTEIFKRDEVGKLLQTLKAQYDWVLLDCPPLLLFADSLMLGPKADGVVLLYQVGRMARSALKRAKDELLTVKARPLGIVLNDVRPKELEPRYGYYRSYYYYQYYQQEKA